VIESVAIRVSVWFNPGNRLPRIGITDNWAELLVMPSVAVTVTVPCTIPVASPCVEAELLMDATEIDDEFQKAVAVRFCLLPSVYVPVAVNCC